MTAPATPRNLLRSTGAILLAFIAVFVLSLATDQVFHLLEVYPPWGQPMFDTAPVALALSYRLIYGVLGGYLAARFAPRNALRHALVLGGIGTLLSSAGAVAMWDFGPHWYSVGLALTALPCSWLGAVLYLKRRGGK